MSDSLRFPKSNWKMSLNAAWMALLPTLPILSPLALLSLRWARLHPQLRTVFSIYFSSQLIAAFFTPTPVLSGVLASLRALFLLAFLGVGFTLRTRHLRWLLIGLTVVYITSYLDSFLSQRSSSLLDVRLLHPFLTSPSVGIAGALGVLLCVALPRVGLWWRLSIGLLALSVCLLSGSRAPLLGLIVSVVLILSAQKRRGVILFFGGLLLLAVLSVSSLGQGNTLERFATIGGSDRDLIWSNTISVMAAHPWGGVGSYQLGTYLMPPGQPCVLWASLAERGVECPKIAENLQGAWLIAHNLMLQQFAETGIVGTIGFALLLGVSILLILRSSQIVAGIGTMLLTVSLVDNVLLVPSPFFAEIFWIVVGISQVKNTSESESTPIFEVLPYRLICFASSLALLIFLFPLWSSLNAHKPVSTVQIVATSGARIWPVKRSYPAYIMLSGKGEYRVVLRACLSTCRTLGIVLVDLEHSNQQVWDGFIQERLPGLSGHTVEMRFELYPLNSPPVAIQPLARQTWQVALK